VVRSDAAFEEAEAEHAEKRARHPRGLAPPTIKKISEPFRLAAEGRVEIAILWKNLILLGRYSWRRLFFATLPMMIMFGVMAGMAGRRGIFEVLGVMCVTLLFMTLVGGPMMVQGDLRRDLGNLALLKAWPVRGATLIRGEVLAPALVLSCTALVLIAAGASLLGAAAVRSIGLGDLLGYVTAAIVLAPPLLLIEIVLQNAIAVVFPSWAVVGPTRAAGIDAMGQRILMMIGTLLGLAIGLIPAAVAAVVTGFGLYMASGRILVVIPAIVGAVVILAECWMATELLGAVLDRTDISAVDAMEK